MKLRFRLPCVKLRHTAKANAVMPWPAGMPAGLLTFLQSKKCKAQGIEAEIPQNPAGVRGIGVESPVPGGAGDAPKSEISIVSEYWPRDSRLEGTAQKTVLYRERA
jgi:hypothetical protein